VHLFTVRAAHLAATIVARCLPVAGGEDFGNCRAVSHSLQTAESTEADLLCHQWQPPVR